MYRIALVVLLSTPAAALAGSCSVSGKALDAGGQPLRDAVVRLVDLPSGQATFRAANSSADFTFDGVPGSGPYRIDVISRPTIVTGTKIPTRSILGMTPDFSCGTGMAHQDVHVQVY
jgi:hypothetical protein